MNSPPPPFPPGAHPTRNTHRAPAWTRYNHIPPRPPYTAPPPPPIFSAEKTQHTPERILIETFRHEDVDALLEDLPITTPTVRVKILHDAEGALLAEIYGYSPRREYCPAVRRMVEANVRQHGQRVLGASIGEGSLARIVEKFSRLDDIGDGEVKAASAWGRVGKAVLACLILEDTDGLEAVVTTKTNHEVKIKLKGFSLPVAEIEIASFAEQVEEEIRYEFPPHSHLVKDEFEYYRQKAISLGELPEQFKRPNLLSVFATAADFSDAVTALLPLDKVDEVRNAAVSHQPGIDDELETGTSSKEHISGEITSRQDTSIQPPRSITPSSSSSGTGLFITSRTAAEPNSTSTPSDLHALLKNPPKAQTMLLQGQPATNSEEHAASIARFGTTNPSRYDKSLKRTAREADLIDDDTATTSKKRHQPFTTSEGPKSKSKSTAASTSTSTHPQSQDPSPTKSSISSSADSFSKTITHKQSTAAKLIPTREEVHAAWEKGEMSRYTVVQLRGYLTQEGLGAGSGGSHREGLLRRVKESIEGEVEGGGNEGGRSGVRSGRRGRGRE